MNANSGVASRFVAGINLEALAEEEHRLADELRDVLFGQQSVQVSLDLIERCVTFRNWCLDQRASFDAEGQDDKFAELVALARRYEQCERLFADEFRINPTTTWRWATKRTRPSKLVGLAIATDIRTLLVTCVEEDLDKLRSAAAAKGMRCTL